MSNVDFEKQAEWWFKTYPGRIPESVATIKKEYAAAHMTWRDAMLEARASGNVEVPIQPHEYIGTLVMLAKQVAALCSILSLTPESETHDVHTSVSGTPADYCVKSSSGIIRGWFYERRDADVFAQILNTKRGRP